jgi:hypothetical protein
MQPVKRKPKPVLRRETRDPNGHIVKTNPMQPTPYKGMKLIDFCYSILTQKYFQRYELPLFLKDNCLDIYNEYPGNIHQKVWRQAYRDLINNGFRLKIVSESPFRIYALV